MRYLIVGYTAKGGNAEFSSVRGYELKGSTPIPSYEEIRNGCLERANKGGYNFNFFSINFMQFVDEVDYNSFMEVTD